MPKIFMYSLLSSQSHRCRRRAANKVLRRPHYEPNAAHKTIVQIVYFGQMAQKKPVMKFEYPALTRENS